MQLTHKQNKFCLKKHPIILVCDNISNAPNVGSILRLADAFNIIEVKFCGEHIPLGRRMLKTSRSTEKHVSFKNYLSTKDQVNKLKLENYCIVALEITNHSKPISKLNLNPKQPVALVLGDEKHGISEEILLLSDMVSHIEMYGHNSSMNVVTAASIALYEITNQLNNL